MRSGEANERLSGLDALRGVASVCVLLFHYHVLTNDGAGAGKAYLAVDFFFCLSGFVMARTYEARLVAGMSAWRFLRIRVARLLPTMLVGGLIGLPMLYLNQPEPFLISAILNLWMLPAITPGLLYPLNTPAWSVFAELCANACHRFAAQVRIGVIIAIIAVLAIPLAWLSGGATHLDLGSTHATFIGMICRVLFSYFLGVVIWRKCGDRPRIRIPAWLTLIAMPVFFGSVWLLSIDSGVADIVFIFGISPLLLLGGLRLDAGRMGQISGAISFPLYATHYPLIELMLKIGSPTPLIFATCTGLAILITWPTLLSSVLRRGLMLNRFGSTHQNRAL